MIRPLTTIDDCRRVADLEKEIWGYAIADEVVPPTVLIVSVKRGGILLGAFDGTGVMQGFVYSMPGWKGRTPVQWSHMLGVVAPARGKGIARELKLAQRDESLAMGIDLVEWTYDPLQAVNAHFNFARLGVVAEEYEENIYGESSSPLHQGTPTDRFVAEWPLRHPRVERRIASRDVPIVIDGAVASAPIVNPSTSTGHALEPGAGDLAMDAGTLLVEIPEGFSEMQLHDADLALAWRMTTRKIFQTYFGRGYRVVDFLFTRDAGRGHYVLRRQT
jgi:predicted GNAT superfamily acetyltransferase